MEKIFYNYLRPAGRTYAQQIEKYKTLKECNQEQIIAWLEENMTGKEIKQLLSQYMMAEFNYVEPETIQRIRISQEQFEQYFRIIQPQSNPARLRRQMVLEAREGIKELFNDETDD